MCIPEKASREKEHIRDRHPFCLPLGFAFIQAAHNPGHSYISGQSAGFKGRRVSDGRPAEGHNHQKVITDLYGTEVEADGLFEDRARVCIPSDAAGGT